MQQVNRPTGQQAHRLTGSQVHRLTGSQAHRLTGSQAHRLTSKGQALVELATFGAILLFCLTLLLRYGMNANYQQRINMQAFRKAFVRARMPGHGVNRGGGNFDPGWQYETGSSPAPGTTWRNVTYTVVEDKPVFSASGTLPVTERAPVAAVAQAVWSIDMFGEMSYGDESVLPRTEYEINNKKFSFTTAGYREYKYDSTKKGDMLDADGDEHEEYVLAKKDGKAQVLDYQEGEINFSEPLVEGAREAGGLRDFGREYNQQKLVTDSYLSRQENNSAITTTEHINARDTFTRPIITREDYHGGTYNVEDTFATQTTKTWSTDK